MNSVQKFVDAKCMRSANLSIPQEELYRAYRNWCTLYGYTGLDFSGFNQLVMGGLIKEANDGVYCTYSGIALSGSDTMAMVEGLSAVEPILTRRDEFAKAALTAILSNVRITEDAVHQASTKAKWDATIELPALVIAYADATIAALDAERA